MLKALTSFAGTCQGRSFVVQRGKTISDEHPIVRQYPEYFGPITADIRAWESATSAPNEVRSLDLSHVEDEPEPERIERADVSMSLKELKDLAIDVGVPAYGTSKPDLVKRINKSLEG